MAIRGGWRQYTDREKSECDREKQGKHREFEIEKWVGTLKADISSLTDSVILGYVIV